MDRYDQVIHDVKQKTGDRAIRWGVVPPHRLADAPNYAGRVVSAYRGDYRLGEATFHLLFVERKIDSYLDDFGGGPIERSDFDLLVLGAEDEIVLRLYDGLVDRQDLLELAGLIESHNDQTEGFFAAFERANAAGAGTS